MKREFLKKLGIDPETMQAILDQYGNSVENFHDTISGLKDEIKTLKGEVKTKNEEIQTLTESKQSESDDLKAKYDAEVEAHKATKTAGENALKESNDAHEATKTSHVAAETTRTKRDAVLRQLKADGANENFLNTVALAIDIEKVELDGDTIKNWDAVSANVKTEHANVFKEAEIKGTPPGTPPKGDGDNGDSDPFLDGFDNP